MKKDRTIELFQRCDALQNTAIEITLRDGQLIRGIPASFIRGSNFTSESFITAIHLIPEGASPLATTDVLGGHIGTIVNTDDIDAILFLKDNSVLAMRD
ncbi:MAG: hypothetical protein U0V64_06820 [Cyclobacteriaceae bacterium]